MLWDSIVSLLPGLCHCVSCDPIPFLLHFPNCQQRTRTDNDPISTARYPFGLAPSMTALRARPVSIMRSITIQLAPHTQCQMQMTRALPTDQLFATSGGVPSFKWLFNYMPRVVWLWPGRQTNRCDMHFGPCNALRELFIGFGPNGGNAVDAIHFATEA